MCETATQGQQPPPVSIPRPPGGVWAVLSVLLYAQGAFASCTATMQPFDFGNVNALNPQAVTTQAKLSITCTTSGFKDLFVGKNFNVCLAADGGRGSVNRLNPRRLCLNGSCASAPPLNYNLYTDPNRTVIWGAPLYSIKNTVNAVVAVPSFRREHTVEVPVYAQLIPPFTNIGAGRYSADYSGGSTALVFQETASYTPTACTGQTTSGGRVEFSVSAVVTPNCTVSEARDINFGGVLSTDANLQGQSSFKVACTKNTLYNIGLLPSNGDTEGRGEMRAVQAGNPDKIPYQLRAQAGMNGTVWGSSDTARKAGNTGTGTAQTYNVYATVNEVGNYRAGEYRDKVIINVGY